MVNTEWTTTSRLLTITSLLLVSSKYFSPKYVMHYTTSPYSLLIFHKIVSFNKLHSNTKSKYFSKSIMSEDGKSHVRNVHKHIFLLSNKLHSALLPHSYTFRNPSENIRRVPPHGTFKNILNYIYLKAHFYSICKSDSRA